MRFLSLLKLLWWDRSIQTWWHWISQNQNSSEKRPLTQNACLQFLDNGWCLCAASNNHMSYRRNDSYVAGRASNAGLCVSIMCVRVCARLILGIATIFIRNYFTIPSVDSYEIAVQLNLPGINWCVIEKKYEHKNIPVSAISSIFSLVQTVHKIIYKSLKWRGVNEKAGVRKRLNAD